MNLKDILDSEMKLKIDMSKMIKTFEVTNLNIMQVSTSEFESSLISKSERPFKSKYERKVNIEL